MQPQGQQFQGPPQQPQGPYGMPAGGPGAYPMQIPGVPYGGGGYTPQFPGPPMAMGPYGPQPMYMMAAPPPPGGYVQPPFSTSPGGHGMMPMMMVGPGAMPPQPGPPFGGGGPPMPPVTHHIPHGSPAPVGAVPLSKSAEVTPSKALKILDKEHNEIDLHAPAAPVTAAASTAAGKSVRWSASGPFFANGSERRYGFYDGMNTMV